MKTKYILVKWPECQHFIGIKGCYFISLGDDDLELDQAVFVPEKTYNKIMSND